MLKSIKKRNGQVGPFNPEKITEAIYKASLAVGNPDWELAKELADEVIKGIEGNLKKGDVPDVEGVQDMVEQVLIDTAHAKIAKAYILYREHRADIRSQKEQILNKGEIDEVDKKFDPNALRVLASRYLVKDDEGNIIESPKTLFSRVSTHVVLSSILFDEKVYQKSGKAPEQKVDEDFDCQKNAGKYAIGQYKLNQFHLEALHRVYNRFAKKRQVKVSWDDLLDLIKKGQFNKYESLITTFLDLMVSRRFLPNTPTIANFGNHLGMGSACFTLPINDSIDEIMDSLKSAAIIFKSGGGLGYNFSNLRPEGDFVKTTGGTASGPLSFMSMFDNMTAVIKQGGIRRGANMGILNSNHPDIAKFIKAKEGNKALTNFNISVMLMPDFWKALKEKKPYQLINPRSGKVVNEIDPEALFDMIAFQAWESAEPGMLFFDNINEHNPLIEALGPIQGTNPCGEVTLYPFESCNLGSLNVWNYLERGHGKKAEFNWDALARDVKIAMRFLDNVIEINNYPLQEIEDMTLMTRKIGLGIMGLANLLYELEITYNSKEGIEFMERIMEFVNYHSKLASIDLAKERGKFAIYDKSTFKQGKLPFSGYKDKKACNLDWDDLIEKIKKAGVRNSFTTVLAPTGSISMIAGCSSGIEPVFSLVFEKNVAIGSFYYVDPVFEEVMKKEGLMDDILLRDVVALNGSVQAIPYIPPKLKKTFVTAMDISPSDHVKVLAALQKWTDSSISKTNNLPAEATVEDIKEIYMQAHETGCKGVTVYRDKSLHTQVLNVSSKKQHDEKKAKDVSDLKAIKDEKTKGMSVYVKAGSIAAPELDLSPAKLVSATATINSTNEKDLKNCPLCKTILVRQEGCKKCASCGWALCG